MSQPHPGVQTDEGNWLDKIKKGEPREVSRVEIATKDGPLLLRRIEIDGDPRFTLSFKEVKTQLLPSEVLRLVQMCIAMADLERK
jgi:hypothetical protein